MNTFQSTELFGAFLVFVAVFITIVLLDLWYQQCCSNDTAKPIYGKHHNLRFQVKKIMAYLFLKLGKRKEMPNEKVDQLQVFSEIDKMVR